MPFQSDQQRRFLYSQKPDIAKKFAKHGGGGKMSDMKAAANRRLRKEMDKKKGTSMKKPSVGNFPFTEKQEEKNAKINSVQRRMATLKTKTKKEKAK